MPEHGAPPGDEHTDVLIARILRAVVALASALVMLGVFFLVWHRGEATVDYRTFRGEPTDLRGGAQARLVAVAIRCTRTRAPWWRPGAFGLRRSNEAK